VTVLTRSPKQAAWLFDGQVRCIASMDDLPATRRIDVIVNLAGARILGWRWTAARRKTLRQSRVDLTRNVVDWIAKARHKPKLLLSASAIGYYGIQAQGDATVLDEGDGSQPVFMSSLCQEWEAAAQDAGRYGVRVYCMRFGVVFGHQGALPMMLLPIKLGLGGSLGSGRQWMSWIHVQDVLAGIAHLWKISEQRGAVPDMPDSAGDGVVNFTAPDCVPQREFSKVAGKVLRRPSCFPTPGFPMRAVLGEQADLLLEGQRVFPRRLLDVGFAFRYPKLEGALRSLA
jgi:uncharacterized protein (TIGR01777 family)